ncbi:MAG TPA: class I SAM-dependent methyltransferase, partial [Vicinamibacterales bacterium]
SYSGAIAAQVSPGDRVIEIGAGLGFFSMMAVRAGAELVDAIELNPVAHLGPRIAAANGYAERIRFHVSNALAFTPDRRADVVIADLRGPTPFAGESLKVLIDARRRLLRDGGVMIARADRLWCAPVNRVASFERHSGAPLTGLGVDFEVVKRVIADTPVRCGITPDELCAAPASWGLIDYLSIEHPSCSGSAQWRFDTATEVRGLAVWFEADLGAGHAFNSSPHAGRSVYSQLYVPFRQPFLFAAEEALHVNLASRLAGDDYVWEWSARAVDRDGVERTSITQNSIAAQIIDPAAHRRPSS